MIEKKYLVATLKKWNVKLFHEVVKQYDGDWQLVTSPKCLTIDYVRKVSPRYIFFPHWSSIVPDEIIANTDCVCFHMTDLPFGQGGSPLQNLIKRGYKTTVISALKMTSKIDAGPIYMKSELALNGSAEEIFIRAGGIITDMIKSIILTEPTPIPQKGKPIVFQRRKPEQSVIDSDIRTLDDLYDHIRMLDAEGYPDAFLDIGEFRFEFSKATLKSDEICSNVRITKRNIENDD